MQSENRTSIGKRLVLFMALMLSINAVIFLYNLHSVQKEGVALEQLNLATQKLQAFNQFSREVLQTNLGYMDAIIDKDAGRVDPDILEQHTHFPKWFTENHDKLLDYLARDELKEEFRQTAQDVLAWEKAGEELFAAIKNRAPAEDYARFDDVLDSTLDHIVKRNEKILVGANAEYAAIVAESQRANSLTYWAQIISMGIMLLVGVVLIWLLLNSIKGLMLGVVSSLAGSSQQIKGEADGVAATSGQLSDAANRQASALQETVASIEQISAMVERNAQSARKSTEASTRSRQAATQGQEMVQGMIQAMNEIATSNGQIMSQMESSNQEFANIIQVIREIGDKTKVINDIVFQTRLLSFNASVEAARAGEHGKGFAVVAEEVGNLASMSGRAASEITELLEKSIQQVTKTVEQTRHSVDQLVRVGREKVGLGEERARACGETLGVILQNAVQVNEMVGEIANASQEQSLGINEVNRAVQQLDEATHKNVEVSRKTTTMADSLKLEVEALNAVIADLTTYVGGQGLSNGGGATSGRGGSRQREHQPLAKVVALQKSETTASAQVARSVKTQVSGSGDRQMGWKAASGDAVLPSSDDPRFDDV